jgi:hypothetical protein
MVPHDLSSADHDEQGAVLMDGVCAGKTSREQHQFVLDGQLFVWT